jgi:FlaA1/EpsC-like NDP-sugar epimerase
MNRHRIDRFRAAAPRMLVDGILFALAWVVAFQLRVERLLPEYLDTILITTAPLVLFKLGVHHLMGSYRSAWRSFGFTDLEDLVCATFLCGAGSVALGFFLPGPHVLPRSVPFMDMALSLLLTGAARMTVRAAGGGPSLRTTV